MNHIINEVEPPPITSPASVVRPLSRLLETTDVALNYFELAPGETFGFDYHRHLDQEEVFYVLRGTATFHTESGDIEVADGEVIRFEQASSSSAGTKGRSGWLHLAIPRRLNICAHVRCVARRRFSRSRWTRKRGY